MARTDEQDDPDAGLEIDSDVVEDTTDGPAPEAVGEGTSDGDESADAVAPSSGRFAAGDGDFDTVRLYLTEIGGSRLLTAEEEVRFTRLAHSGDDAARQRMIVSNLRLVVKVAHRYLNRGLPLPDLIEEGNLGLMQAVEKFDPERGFRFSTYAIWWIRQSIERAIMNQARTVRLPIHVNKEINTYLRAARGLNQKLDHEPTTEDIADLLNKPIGEVKRLLDLNEHITSVDTPYGKDADGHLLDKLQDESAADLADKLHDHAIRSKLDHWLEKLNSKQREVVERRFGLHGHDRTTLECVAWELGVTRERVRQIQITALRQLRSILEQEGFSVDAFFR